MSRLARLGVVTLPRVRAYGLVGWGDEAGQMGTGAFLKLS